MKLYVGNLPFTAQEKDVRAYFESAGPVNRVSIITDKETGRARGFCFVEYTNDADAQSAISSFDGKDFGGRSLKVNQAVEKPRPQAQQRH